MLRILAANTVSAALFALLMALHDGEATLLHRFVVASLYTQLIGITAQLVLPSLGHRLSSHVPAVFWLGMTGALAGLAVAGALVAGSLAAALGLFGPARRGQR